MHRIERKQYDSLGPLALCIAVAASILLLTSRLLHADTGAPPAATSFDWQFWLMVSLAAGGGLLKILDVLLAGLRWLAPRTKTTLDDDARDDLQVVHDKLGEAVAVLTRIAPPAPARSPQAGRARLGVLLVLLAGAAAWGISAIALLAVSCTPAQRQDVRDRGGAAAGAFMECESPHVDAAMLEDAKHLAKEAVVASISGDGHADGARLKADAAPLQSDLARCAWEAAIAALATPVPKQPGAPMAAGLEIDGTQLRATWAQVRGEIGWAPVRVAGQVL